VTPRRCLAVVIPCFNERPTVEEVVERVLDSAWVDEVIIVDDGSTDGTGEVLAKLDHPRLRVLTHERNSGKGAALRTGFAAASAEYVIVQDADLEYDPSEYATMLEPLEAGHADVVFGSRFLSGRPHRVLYFWHSLGNRWLTLMSNMFTDLNLTDMESCYKAFRREVLATLTIEENRFGIEPELTAKVARGRWRLYEVGISYAGRTYAEGKKIGWRDGRRAVVCIVRYSPLGERFRWSRLGRLLKSTGDDPR
jgi:glycosyltransferase involved in cell wall biosynthesis